MSILGKVIVFALKETARPLLTNVGRHIGNAVGMSLGRKINPDYAPSDDEDALDEMLADAPEIPDEPGDDEPEPAPTSEGSTVDA